MHRNYIYLGPVHLKVSGKGLASWGYPRIRMGGISLFNWGNEGSFHLVSYHPKSSITWLWDLMIGWPNARRRNRDGWWRPGRWVSPVGRGWSYWALGFSVSWSSQDRMNWPDDKEQS